MRAQEEEPFAGIAAGGRKKDLHDDWTMESCRARESSSSLVKGNEEATMAALHGDHRCQVVDAG